jgi:hypothetical protein
MEVSNGVVLALKLHWRKTTMNFKAGRTLTGTVVVMTLGMFAIPFGASASAGMVQTPTELVQYAQDDHTQVQVHTERDVTNSTTGITDTPVATEQRHQAHETTETDHQQVGADGTVSESHSKTRHVVKKEQTNLDGDSSTENHEQVEQQTTTEKSVQN